MALSRFVRGLITLKFLIKEVVNNFGINSEKLKFMSSSTAYEYKKSAIVVATIPNMNTILNKNLSSIIG